jgi:hypothetical protein
MHCDSALQSCTNSAPGLFWLFQFTTSNQQRLSAGCFIRQFNNSAIRQLAAQLAVHWLFIFNFQLITGCSTHHSSLFTGCSSHLLYLISHNLNLNPKGNPLLITFTTLHNMINKSHPSHSVINAWKIEN